MNFLLRPQWILYTLSIPQLMLALIWYSSYRIIGSLLPEDSIVLWKGYGAALAALWLVFTGYAALMMRNRTRTHLWAVIAILLAHILFLYSFATDINDFLPWNIPRWMLFDGDIQMLAFSFIMPCLLHAVLMLVALATPDLKAKAWVNLVVAVCIPVTWYLGVSLFESLRLHNIPDGFQHFVVVLFIASTVVFFFFLVRWIYLVVSRSEKKRPVLFLILKILIAVVFPTLGLALNNGDIDLLFRSHSGFGMIFGDFSSPWFYWLSLINGILVCIPDSGSPRLRLSVFLMRMITVPFTLYFFFVFIPWFPISVAAIIAFGAGFLMLSPLLLTFLHLKALSNDMEYLKAIFRPLHLKVWGAAACFLIPGFIIVQNLYDRHNLDTALDYVYAPDLSLPDKKVNTNAILRTLDEIRKSKSRSGNFIFGGQRETPYLTGIYRKMVLDNLTLSDEKEFTLRKIFSGNVPEYDPSRWWRRPLPEKNPDVKIDSLKVNTRLREKEGDWETTVDLYIRNHHENNFQEYSTSFTLPEGCMISDYYLYVEDVKKKGLLAEKRAAQWVYQNIVNTNRDPGILHYTHGNEISFRVFPFGAWQTRKTGFTLLHKEPIRIQLDSLSFSAGDSSGLLKPEPFFMGEGAVYIPASMKKELPLEERTPYYHFIVDCSERTGRHQKKEFIARINKLLGRKLVPQEGAEISFTNYRSESFPLSAGWEDLLEKATCTGGFFPERVMQRRLTEHLYHAPDHCPVFVVVSDFFDEAVFTGGLSELYFTYPDLPVFYVLREEGQIASRHMGRPGSGIVESNADRISPGKVRVFEYSDKHFLPDDGQGGFVFLNRWMEVADTLATRDWKSGIRLLAGQKFLTLNPDMQEYSWKSMVQNSFRTGIMTPYTSYIVLENEAQEKAMLEKQKEILASKQSLDVSDDVTQMSEPGIWVMAAAMVVMMILLRRKRKVN